MFRARIGRLDHFAIGQVVVAVHQVDEQYARFGVVVGAGDDLFPQIGSAHFAIYPFAVVASYCARSFDSDRRFGGMYQLEVLIGFHGLHQGVGHADRDVEVAQVAFVLGADEFLDVGVIATQYAHLCAASRSGGFHGLAGTVKHAHIRDRAAGARIGAPDMRTFRADGREVVTDAAAAPHGFGGLLQGVVDARLAVGVAGDGIAYRLHEAVDERRLNLQTGGRVDAPGRHEAVLLRFKKCLFPLGALLRFLGLRQAACYAAAHVLHGFFVGFCVFLQQNFGADLLCHDGGSFKSGFPN